MDRLRVDYLGIEPGVDARGVEELLARAYLEGLRMTGRPVEPEEQYDDIDIDDFEDYDPLTLL